jgi:hypothetical protein
MFLLIWSLFAILLSDFIVEEDSKNFIASFLCAVKAFSIQKKTLHNFNIETTYQPVIFFIPPLDCKQCHVSDGDYTFCLEKSMKNVS